MTGMAELPKPPPESPPTSTPPTSTPHSARRRRVVFRVAAILLSLLPLLVAEVVCRMAGWGRITEIDDPYVGFTATHPLFELDATGRRYEIAKSRQTYFRPDSFSAAKPADEFRVFCLGGSTVQGRPYAIETSFTTWLELSLRAADERRRWRVVNCGGVSYASYRLAPIIEELLAYEPDLFIVYTGHNEFLEDRTYRDVKRSSWFVRRLHEAASRLRIYNVARATWLGMTAVDPAASAAALEEQQINLPAEVDALLDYRGGLAEYHRDDGWQRDVADHYEFNLRRMVRLAREAGVPIVLVNPVSNLKDCPPFKFEPSVQDQHRREQFDALWEAAKAAREPDGRIELLETAVALDSRHAGAHFLLGLSYLETGRLDVAQQALLHAKDEDICPLRMIEPLHQRLGRVARATGTPLVDVRALLAEASPGGLVGNELLLDHIHPTINGHQRIAAALLDQLASLGLVSLRPGWEERRRESYDQHLETLDVTYYARGHERLEGLIRWTQGRSNRLKPSP